MENHRLPYESGETKDGVHSVKGRMPAGMSGGGKLKAELRAIRESAGLPNFVGFRKGVTRMPP